MISELIICKKVLWLILIAAFLIRIYNLSFPYFTSDEARIAFRGYTLSTEGKDELGRPFPYVFNSLTDYQLPVVSYITAAGIKLFGKNDFGVRIPFILISLVIVLLVYKTSKIFSAKKEFQLLSALTVAFSPALIFLSKIPNETILLIFSFMFLFYLLTKEKINLVTLSIGLIFALAVSKIAWWTILPFIVFTLVFFQASLQIKQKINIIIITLVLVGTVLILFLRIPQATRSLWENDFPIFRDTSISAVSNNFRGQGLNAGWPNYLEKLIFNKMQFVNLGLINWFDYLSPAVFFSQFDLKSTRGYMSMGQFPAVMLLSFVAGLVFIAGSGNRKMKALFGYLLILSFPLFFIFPGDRHDIGAIVLPFISFIIALGLFKVNKVLRYMILIFAVLEILINIIYFQPEVVNANNTRPVWVKDIIKESFNLSLKDKVAVSDNLVSDIVPLIEWLSPMSARDDYKNINFPYKFRKTTLPNIRLVGTDDIFYFCGSDKPTYVIASKRDLEKIQRWLNIDTQKSVQKIYHDGLGDSVAYLLNPTICVH